MFCPRCGAEHHARVLRCSDCDIDLVPSLPADFTDERVVVAWGGDDPVDFSVVIAALRAANIPAREISQYNGLMSRRQPRRPGYEIAVHPQDVDRASETIRAALAAKGSQ